MRALRHADGHGRSAPPCRLLRPLSRKRREGIGARGVLHALTRLEDPVKQTQPKHIQTISSDVPAEMTLPEYRRLLGRPRRHSPIRRFASFGLLR
jgi:hypothetical protein